MPNTITSLLTRPSRFWQTPWPFAGVLLLIHYALILWGPLGISGDEAQYWLWSRHLSLGYYTKGPLLAWFMAVSRWIFGDTLLGVRAWAPIFSFTVTLLAWFFAWDVWRDLRAAWVACLALSITPIVFLGGMVFTTDVPMLTFWTLTLWSVWRTQARGEAWQWLLAGVWLGLGLLSKYNMGTLPLAIFLVLLFSADGRQQLSRKEPWLGALIALLILSPNLYWNATHHWVTMQATWGNATGGQGGWRGLGTFLAGQLGVLGVFPAILLVFGLWRSRQLRTRGWTIIMASSLLIWFFYLLKSATGQIDANWPAESYIGLWIWAAGSLARLSRRYLIPAMFLPSLLIATVLALPTAASWGLPVPPHWFVPFKQTRGWNALGRKVEQVLDEQHHSLIATDFYQYSAVLSFVLPGHPFVYYNDFSGTPARNQYALWPRFSPRPSQRVLLLLSGLDQPLPPDARHYVDHCGAGQNFFASSQKISWHHLTLYECQGRM